MNQETELLNDDKTQLEYDLFGGMLGKHYETYQKFNNPVVLDCDCS